MMAWMRMPVDMILHPDQKAEYIKLTNAIGIYFGFAYVLLIILFYAPVKLKLNWIQRVYFGGKGETIEETVKRTFALLAPFLAATASALGVPNTLGL